MEFIVIVMCLEVNELNALEIGKYSGPELMWQLMFAC